MSLYRDREMKKNTHFIALFSRSCKIFVVIASFYFPFGRNVNFLILFALIEWQDLLVYSINIYTFTNSIDIYMYCYIKNYVHKKCYEFHQPGKKTFEYQKFYFIWAHIVE